MIPDKLKELLLTVQKPGRYVGGEWNSVRKEWTDDKVKVCLAFPDTYEVGMSNLGIKILYGILNERSDCLCERVFSPWHDFEAALRSGRIEIFSLESGTPIRKFDIVGFSFAYELTFTNVLNILSLGNIPLRSSERGEGDPLVIAGGPSAFNPEPMAEFVDAFLIGDGEDAIGDIVEACKRPSGEKRERLLRRLADIDGVYVPSLYRVEYNDDRTIKRFYPAEKGVPPVIEKRIVRDLDAAFYPTRQIVPNIQIVHDRIAIEIMRGCKHACKFCQAACVYRPCRERTAEKILKLAEDSYRQTGYDEISLLSLSSGDHSRIREIMMELNEKFSGRSVSISVPSLRIEEITRDLPFLISRVKKSGLTFAPEAGSESLRKTINKNIETGRLFEAALESFKRGWNRIKLYFMMGLPGETDEDLHAISRLVYAISDSRRSVVGKSARVAISINSFIPKPHSPFQLEPMDGMASLERKRDLVRGDIASRITELSFHPINMSYIEAVMCRGDRRLSEAIYHAWKEGCRFDGWSESFNFGLWTKSLAAAGIDPSFYINRPRPKSEILPWSFIAL
jgi:radical SAM family uncharacterized protein